MLPCKKCITLAICKSVIKNPKDFIRFNSCSAILEYLNNPTINGMGEFEWTSQVKDLQTKFNEINSILNYYPKITATGVLKSKEMSTNIWQRRKPLAKIALKRFLKFMEKQEKIKQVEDLVPQMMYSSLFGLCTPTYVRRAILRRGIDDAKERGLHYDALINIEVEANDNNGTFVYIWKHKTNKPLTDFNSWEDDN